VVIRDIPFREPVSIDCGHRLLANFRPPLSYTQWPVPAQ